MIDVILLFFLAPFAAIGAVTIGNFTGGYCYDREVKRKEKFKQDVLKVLKENENAEV